MQSFVVLLCLEYIFVIHNIYLVTHYEFYRYTDNFYNKKVKLTTEASYVIEV